MIHIVHVEDDPDDAELIAATLRADGLAFRSTVVATEEQFRQALAGEVDLILSDFGLPQFDGQRALAMARAIRPEVPFVFVSGTIGEEAAVDGLRGGATDYVIKDRLGRLASAVRRALSEAAALAAQREAERERQALSEQLREAQKMEALGQLTGGIAHDFNNILAVITANAELVRQQLPPRATQARSDLDFVVAACVRGKELVRKLLGFSRRQALELRRVDLNAHLTELVAAVRHVVPSTISVALELAADLPPARLDPSALDQVLLNLITNARDAMPDGGRLTIRTREIQDEDEPPPTAPLERGTCVGIEVEDTGHGMDEHTRSQVFEPFFTTKGPGKGTGLGMAMIYGIMRQHKGGVGLASTPGVGTRVLLYFPQAARAVREPAGTPQPPSEARPIPAGGGETVLVAEDELAIRSAIRRVLERHGYTVLEAHDGAEALDLLRSAGNAVRLVISDQEMPRMTGASLFHSARLAGIRVPFIMMTGGMLDPSLAGARAANDCAVLTKPYLTEELLHRVREGVDRGR